jgi:hypothetical protein
MKRDSAGQPLHVVPAMDLWGNKITYLDNVIYSYQVAISSCRRTQTAGNSAWTYNSGPHVTSLDCEETVPNAREGHSTVWHGIAGRSLQYVSRIFSDPTGCIGACEQSPERQE